MFGAIPMIAAGASAFEATGGAHQEAIQKLVQQVMAQTRANAADTAQTSHSLTKEIVNERIRSIALSADRTIANAQSERLLDKLASKFSLISSMQRSIG